MSDIFLDYDLIKTRLIDFEGMVLKAYSCPAGKITVCVGRNAEDKGFTEEEAMFLLHNDIDDCIDDLNRNIPRWISYPEPVQYVLIDLCFNLGISTLLSFRKTLKHIDEGSYEAASKELLNSRYAKQVGRRALFNSEQLASCQKRPTNN